jgi:hypothetical protein
VSAEHGPQAFVTPLAHEVHVELAERRPQAPRLDGGVLAAAVPAVGHPVAGVGRGVDQRFEHAGVVDAPHRAAAIERRRRRPRPPRPYHGLPGIIVDAEEPVRVAASALDERGDLGLAGRRRGHGGHHPARERVRRTADAGMSTQS